MSSPAPIANVSTLANSIEAYAKVFGSIFKAASADRSYYNEDLIKDLEDKYRICLAISYKKNRNRKMTEQKEKLFRKRLAIEAKIS